MGKHKTCPDVLKVSLYPGDGLMENTFSVTVNIGVSIFSSIIPI